MSKFFIKVNNYTKKLAFHHRYCLRPGKKLKIHGNALALLKNHWRMVGLLKYFQKAKMLPQISENAQLGAISIQPLAIILGLAQVNVDSENNFTFSALRLIKIKKPDFC